MEFPGYSTLSVGNPFGAPVLRVAETSSTMEDARALAARGAPSGTAVTADFQSAGRGRFRDRSWSGERGRDLLFTLMLELDLEGAAAFPLRVGLAVCRAVEGLSGAIAFRLKWPNDLLADGMKVCGILCESSGGRYFAGIGVNCAAREFPLGLRHPATSLEAVLGACVDRFDLLGRILDELSRSFSRPDWISEVAERLYRRGQPLRFLEGRPEDGRVVEGVLVGLGKGGELLIDIDGAGIRSYSSGEILRNE